MTIAPTYPERALDNETRGKLLLEKVDAKGVAMPSHYSSFSSQTYGWMHPKKLKYVLMLVTEDRYLVEGVWYDNMEQAIDQIKVLLES